MKLTFLIGIPDVFVKNWMLMQWWNQHQLRSMLSICLQELRIKFFVYIFMIGILLTCYCFFVHVFFLSEYGCFILVWWWFKIIILCWRQASPLSLFGALSYSRLFWIFTRTCLTWLLSPYVTTLPTPRQKICV